MEVFNSTKYKNEFAKEKYDRVVVVIPKGMKDEWKDIASKHNKSLNAFVVEAITEKIEKLK